MGTPHPNLKSLGSTPICFFGSKPENTQSALCYDLPPGDYFSFLKQWGRDAKSLAYDKGIDLIVGFYDEQGHLQPTSGTSDRASNSAPTGNLQCVRFHVRTGSLFRFSPMPEFAGYGKTGRDVVELNLYTSIRTARVMLPLSMLNMENVVGAIGLVVVSHSSMTGNRPFDSGGYISDLGKSRETEDAICVRIAKLAKSIQ